MKMAKTIGTVTLNRCHPSFVGARLKMVVPLSLANLRGEKEPNADPLVVWDELGAGIGSIIGLSEGAEAAQPFRPHVKPIDAYNAALLDTIDIEPSSD